MFFLNYNSALGYTHSADITPTDIEDITYVSVSNQICDELFISKDANSFNQSLPITWDSNTILDAKFENSLIAGNVSLTLAQLDNIRIKYREVNSYDWVIFSDIPIKVASDLIFTRFNRFCRANTTYEFSISTMLNGVEGSIMTNTIESNFDEFYIMEKDSGYHGINIEITPTRNQTSSIITPLDGKYPVVIYNTEMNYDSLNVKGMFIQLVNNEFDKVGAWKYRDSMKDFLLDKKSKIIKYSDGRCFLVAITDNVVEDSSQYNAEGYTLMDFVATEVGNYADTQMLYDAGLVSINTDYYY